MTTPAFEALLKALSSPGAYPDPVDRVEVVQTHISAVFLAGPLVYKVKKPVNFGFLDFSTLERRKIACEDEVRLNRRLAPRTYRGVVPIARTPEGIRIGGEGTTIDYAVCMERLPADRTYERLLERGAINDNDVDRLARRVARFHKEAASTPEIAAEARWEVVAGNQRENFVQIKDVIGRTISRAVYDRLQSLTEDRLTALKSLIESRAKVGIARDTHGDLHLDHVYSLPQAQGPDDLVIIDCIEFNTRFRYADPVSDIAFLVMDLAFHGHPRWARLVADAYFEESGDWEGRSLLDFYAAYRAVVRGKVEGFAVGEEEVPEEERSRCLQRARAHFLLALGFLAPPPERPALILVAGLPGSGKSVLCKSLEADAAMTRFDSDAVRKELAGIDSGRSAANEWERGIYTPAWNERTYAALLERAETRLFEGERVVVEASFREEARRLPFLELARSLCLPCLFLECSASDPAIHERLRHRQGDPSDAGIEVYEAAKQRWEKPGPEIGATWHRVSTETDPRDGLQAALALLREHRLA